jgi:hypothetical protein
MKQNRKSDLNRVRGLHAPAERLTLNAAFLVAIGLSSAFLLVLAGFMLAITLVNSS